MVSGARPFRNLNLFFVMTILWGNSTNDTQGYNISNRVSLLSLCYQFIKKSLSGQTHSYTQLTKYSFYEGETFLPERSCVR